MHFHISAFHGFLTTLCIISSCIPSDAVAQLVRRDGQVSKLSMSPTSQAVLVKKAYDYLAMLMEKESPTGLDAHPGVARSIPNRLVFNDKDEWTDKLSVEGMLSETDMRGGNVGRILKLFPDMPEVEFLGDALCSAAVEKAHSKKLAMHFDAEKTGMYKSDVCRLAQLALHGGYYMDTDLEPIEDMRKMVPPQVSFASVIALNKNGTNEMFQAFLAAAPGHPVILSSLDKCLDYYERRNGTLMDLLGGELRGTLLMRLAYEEWLTHKMKAGLQEKFGEDKFKYSYLFQEEIVNNSDYPQLPPHSPVGLDNGEVYCCNIAVIDPSVRNVFAWSHATGSRNCPSSGRNNLQPEGPPVSPPLDSISLTTSQAPV